MSFAPVDLDNCYARVMWVEHALHTLNEEFRLWMLEHDPHRTVVEYQSETDIHLFRLQPEVPPHRFGVIAGNVIHQLRATLDNLVWQLVLANRKTPREGKRGNQFPVLDEDDPDKSFADRTATALRGVHPDHVAMIEGFQPYKHPDWRPHPIGRLARLNNRDKHQILKVVVVERVPGPRQFPDPEPTFEGDEIDSVVDSWAAPLPQRQPGAIVGWAKFSPAGFHHDVHMKHGGWGRLAFEGEGPLIPQLQTLHVAVENIINISNAVLTKREGVDLSFSAASVARLLGIRWNRQPPRT